MPEAKQNKRLLTEECPICGGLGEVLNQKVRAMGYTLTEGETIDEVLVPCPLCERVKSQDAKTLREVGEWLESKMFAIPKNLNVILRGVEWHIRLDHIETLKQGKMPE